ncbi:MAG: hypothetical protein IJS94_04460 [Clostridia bacterium]|nr:hypothetical protein [Clostridia bacterium]
MRTALKIISGLLVFASVSLAFVSFAAGTLLGNKEKYIKNILTDEFDSTLLTDIETAIRGEGDQLALDYDKIILSLDKEQLIDYAHSYTSAFIDSVINDRKFDFDEEFDSDSLYDEVYRQITEMGYEAGLTGEEIESDSKSVYNYLKKDIDQSLKYIPALVVNKTDDIRSALNKVRPYTVYGWWFLIFAAVFTVVSAFASIYKKGVLSGAFFVVLPYWFAATLVFVPSLMFAIYDSTSKIIIGKSAVYFILSGVLKTVEKQLLDSSVLFFAATTLLTFLTAYLMIFKSKKTETLSSSSSVDLI